jgi:hypothetical protein
MCSVIRTLICEVSNLTEKEFSPGKHFFNMYFNSFFVCMRLKHFPQYGAEGLRCSYGYERLVD